MSKIVVASFQSLSAHSGEGMARLGYFISKELHQRGLLKKFVVHSKGKHETPFPSVPVSPASRYYLFALNKLNSIFNFKTHRFRLAQEKLYDYFCAEQLDASVEILFVTTPFLKRTFKKAKKLGIKTVLLSGTPEENYIYDLVTEENKKLGINNIDAYTFEDRIRFFNQSIKNLDQVVGSLPTVYKTYKESEQFKGEVIKLVGHMPPDFKPVELAPKDPKSTPFKVGYVAHTVALKGLAYLLDAWREVTETHHIQDVELRVVGWIDDAIRKYIEHNYSDVMHVNYEGHTNDVPSFLKDLDLFVVPSLIDGAPVSALEAAHYALPVLITENSGSSELLSRGESGCHIIPIRDAKAIEEKILWAYNNREENIKMGMNAKRNMDGYSFPKFMSEVADYLETQLK